LKKMIIIFFKMYTCEICFEEKRKKHILPCNHHTCKLCFNKLMTLKCPFCRAPFTREKKDVVINDPEPWRELETSEWVSYSRYLRNGTEIISTFRVGNVPDSWRSDVLTTKVKKRRKRKSFT